MFVYPVPTELTDRFVTNETKANRDTRFPVDAASSLEGIAAGDGGGGGRPRFWKSDMELLRTSDREPRWNSQLLCMENPLQLEQQKSTYTEKKKPLT